MKKEVKGVVKKEGQTGKERVRGRSKERSKGVVKNKVRGVGKE